MKTRVLSIAALAVTALVATTGALAGGTAKKAGTLSGAGATFPFPLISQWQKDYESKTGTHINYNPIGSGGGIAAITARTVDFGASDAPLTPDQVDGLQGLRPDPVGAVLDVGHLQPAERPEQPEADRAGDREHLPRQDHAVGRPRRSRR